VREPYIIYNALESRFIEIADLSGTVLQQWIRRNKCLTQSTPGDSS
jgi:hypothetical protein